MRVVREGEKEKPAPPSMAPMIIIIVVCVTPLLTMRSIMTPWLKYDRRGGEDEHKRGIVMTKN